MPCCSTCPHPALLRQSSALRDSETPDHTQGGGIPEDSLEQVFQYGYTTVDDGDLLAQVPPAPLGPQRHVLCGLHCHLRLDVRLSSTRHALAAAEMYVARPACPRRAGSWWPILMDTTASIYMVCMHPVKKVDPKLWLQTDRRMSMASGCILPLVCVCACAGPGRGCCVVADG